MSLSSALYCDAPEERWGSCIGVGEDWSIAGYTKNHCPAGFTYTGDRVSCAPFFFMGKCRRTTFDLDNELGKVKCCLHEDNNPQCPPGYCKAKKDETKCIDVLRKHCNRARLLNRADPGRQECIEWSKNNPGKNDRNMEDYCNTRYAKTTRDPICACFLSELPDGAAACFDTDCINSGYRTQSMIDKAQNCGTFCNIDFTVAGSKLNIDQLKFNQECSDSAQQQQQTDLSGQTGDPNAQQQGSANIGQTSGLPTWAWLLIAGVGALLLVGVIAAIVVATTGKKKPTSEQQISAQFSTPRSYYPAAFEQTYRPEPAMTGNRS